MHILSILLCVIPIFVSVVVVYIASISYRVIIIGVVVVYASTYAGLHTLLLLLLLLSLFILHCCCYVCCCYTW